MSAVGLLLPVERSLTANGLAPFISPQSLFSSGLADPSRRTAELGVFLSVVEKGDPTAFAGEEAGGEPTAPLAVLPGVFLRVAPKGDSVAAEDEGGGEEAAGSASKHSSLPI